MPGSHLFNLGLFQKNFGGNHRIAGVSINLGSTKGRGSSTRMFNYCNQHSENPSECINQFINVAPPVETPIPSYSVTGTYTISSNANFNTIITFTGDGIFSINVPFLISYVVVGGGGGGGSGTNGSGPGGAGGGGGEVIENSTSLLGGSYTITVGTGGPGVSYLNPGQPGTNGGNSTITGNSTSIVANGGQGGQANLDGGASGTPTSTGGTYNPNNGQTSGDGFKGGGGGAAPFVGNGGNGSENIPTLIYGTQFGAGGGGGSGNGNGANGTAGNTNAGIGSSLPAQIYAGNGVANTGGGGGGGSSVTGNAPYMSSGNGGSGVVILYFNF